MIKTEKLTPEIYYKESRDFQLFGRSYDIIFNYLKTNIDLINNPTSKDLSLLQLNALGFFPKRVYDDALIQGLCKSYANIIKNKGTALSIDLAVNCVLKAAGIDKITGKDIYDREIKGNNVTIFLYDSASSSEICLLEEIFDYILPVGVSVEIKPASIYDTDAIQKIGVQAAYQLNKVVNADTSVLRTDTSTDIDESTHVAQTPDYSNPATKKGNQPLGTVRKDGNK